jgi:ABC-type Fe3+-hydroxamate transport system substrate-binding protein
MRVVSLVPSLTELVFFFGRGDWLVGRTKFCTEPRAARVVENVGGTKDPDVPRIIALCPDLVIANREENRREDVEAMQAAGLRALLTDPNTVEEAAVMIRELGTLLDADDRASELAGEIETVVPPTTAGPRVFVAVWRKPLLGLGGESYGNSVLTRAGGVNVLAGRPRYPEVRREELRELAPDLILLPDEPFRFRERHRAEFEDFAPVRLVDGKLLWWYGPRLPGALRGLRAMFADVSRGA